MAAAVPKDNTVEPRPPRFRLWTTRSIYDLGFSRPDDRFIPVRSDDLIQLISGDSDTFGLAAGEIPLVAAQIIHIVDQEMNAFERLTAKAYSHFNPDRETLEIDGLPSSTPVTESKLLEKLHHMLEKANFERLSQEQVDTAIRAGNTQGMRVRLDPDRVSHLSIWTRGQSKAERRRRTWRHPIKGEPYEINIFNRLALIASLKEDQAVNLRLFKQIPIRDVEALLPHASVRLSRKDALMMVGGGAGAAWSVITKLTLLGAAAVTQLLWVLALPLAGLSWKVFSGYRRGRKDRDFHRTRNLYYQGLGSNRSAIHMLANMIAEEEIKEAVLLYAFCSEHALAAQRPSSFEEVGRMIEEYLRQQVGVEVDFDIKDAAETLDRLDLWTDRDRMRVVAPDEALSRLNGHRQERRSAKYHAHLLGITE